MAVIRKGRRGLIAAIIRSGLGDDLTATDGGGVRSVSQHRWERERISGVASQIYLHAVGIVVAVGVE